jgi:hypothetical protein
VIAKRKREKNNNREKNDKKSNDGVGEAHNSSQDNCFYGFFREHIS